MIDIEFLEHRSVDTDNLSMVPNEASRAADVIIVGGGISGTLAASVLSRAGYEVCLVDRYAHYPPDFRAEHLDGPQIDQLRRLGFLDELTQGLYRGETVTLARFGRIIGTVGTINYGLRYEALVNRARANLSSSIRIVIGRVTRIETSDSLQQVTTSDGRIIRGRLIVLATGQGQVLCTKLGIERRVAREAHSLTFGFNIEPVGRASFDHSFVVYQREDIRDRIDYLAAFTMDGTTRVNLFTYRHHRDPWTLAFLTDPKATLVKTLPGLTSAIGDFRVVGPAVARPVDLYKSEKYRRDGVVMIGDAFQAACPATGMGMVRLLTDIEQLTQIHIPRWLQTPGMNAAKITTYYDDPVKQACDSKAMHDSEYRRSVSTEMTLNWRLHRVRVNAVERLNAWRHRPVTSSHPRVETSRGTPSLMPS